MLSPLDNFIEKLASSLTFLDSEEQDLFLDAVRSSFETAKTADYEDKIVEDILTEAAAVCDLYLKRK